MGLNIGPIASTLAVPPQNPAVQPDRPNSAVQRQAEQRAAEQLTPRSENGAPLRAGFGAGTISTPAAALQTLNRTVRSARDVVPTVEESRQRLQERLEENPFVQEVQNGNEFEEPTDLRPPESEPQDTALRARNFAEAAAATDLPAVQGQNTVAENVAQTQDVQGQAAPEPVEPPPPQPDEQITFPNSSPGQLLDLLA